jgi:hypothetical protein
MHWILVVAMLAACTDSYGPLDIVPDHAGPLGVGRTAQYSVEQTVCGGGIDGDCMGDSPFVHVDVRGTAARFGTSFEGWFTIVGVEPGHADAVVTSSYGTTATLEIEVVAP